MENNWISIKKLQPEIGQLALVNLGGYGRYYIANFDWYSREGGNHAWYTEADDVLHAATTDDYWMPIPKKNEFKVFGENMPPFEQHLLIIHDDKLYEGKFVKNCWVSDKYPRTEAWHVDYHNFKPNSNDLWLQFADVTYHHSILDREAILL